MPFFFKNSTGQNDGFCVEMLDLISNRLNFSYTIKSPVDKKYGAFSQETKEWDGMMKMMLDGVKPIFLY